MRYLFSILVLFLLVGCISTTNIDYGNREIKSIEYENVKGKFVPDIVFKEMMNRYIEWNYYNKKYGSIVR